MKGNATAEQIHELLGKILDGDISSSQVAAIIDGRYRTIPEFRPASKNFRLCCTSPDGFRREVMLRDPCHVVIGRTEGDLLVDDPGISAKHAELCLEDGFLTIHDLGSSKGTYVRRLVGMSHAEALEHTSSIEMGETVFEVWETPAALCTDDENEICRVHSLEGLAGQKSGT